MQMRLGYDNWYDNCVAGGSERNGTLRPQHGLARGRIRVREKSRMAAPAEIMIITSQY